MIITSALNPDGMLEKLFSTPSESWSVYVDGATFGSNPSELGAGAFTVWKGSELFYATTSPILSATNNRCEFFALVKALLWMDTWGMQDTAVYTDSDILFKYMNGNAKLTNPHLLALSHKLTALASYTRPVVSWVPRDTRELAFTDYVASYGAGGKRLVFDAYKSHLSLIAGYYSL